MLEENPDRAKTLPLGPARLYVDDVDALLEALRDSGERDIKDWYSSASQIDVELEHLDVRIKSGDLEGRSGDDLVQTPSKMRESLLLDLPRQHTPYITLGHRGAAITYRPSKPWELGVVRKAKAICERRRVNWLMGWLLWLTPKTALPAIIGAGLFAGAAALIASPGSEDLPRVLASVALTAVLGGIGGHAILSPILWRKYGFVHVAAERSEDGRSVWRENVFPLVGAIAAVATTVATLAALFG